MTEKSTALYKETISCEPSPTEGVIFIKVVAMPYADSVEFDSTQARAFAARILAAVSAVEDGWVGKPTLPPESSGA